MSDQQSLFERDNWPPYQRGSETSRLAAEAIEPAADTLRGKVLAYLRTSGKATDEEMQDALKLNPSTQRPRRIELVERSLVRDSGLKRATKSGRWAVVWEAIS